MAVLKRIKDIIAANVNDLLSKAEDPEKSLNLAIKQMEEAIIDYRQNAAAAIAQRKKIERSLSLTKKAAEEWLQNAELAIESDNDELAMQALERKKQEEKKLISLEEELTSTSAQAEKLKNELAMLQDKVQDARSKRDTLLTKKRAIENRERLSGHNNKVNESLKRLNDASTFFEDATIFDELESKIEAADLKTSALQELDGDNLEDQFKEMKRKKALSDELEQLKAKLTK